MIHTDKLNAAAQVIDSQADSLANRNCHRDSNNLRIIAEDLRREAQAGNGYQTRATLALAIVIDNDRDMASHRHQMMIDCLPVDWNDDDAVAEAQSNLADALQTQVELWAGTEGITRKADGESIGAPTGTIELPSIASAFVHYAITCVDWHGLAAHYLSEYKLGEGI